MELTRRMLESMRPVGGMFTPCLFPGRIDLARPDWAALVESQWVQKEVERVNSQCREGSGAGTH